MTTQNGAVSQVAIVARPQADSDVAQWRDVTWLGGILVIGIALRLWLLSRGIPTLDSDEGTIGLMAMHMLHGQGSVFVWGQTYMGSLESVLIAPFLWLFGASPFALRLAPLLIGIAFIVTIYALAVWLFSRRVALVAATLLAIGPPFFMVLSIRAFGGYVETLFFGNLLLLLALRGSAPAWRAPRVIAVMGLLAGIALWTDFLIGPFLIGVLMIFWWQRRTDLLRHNGLILIAALLIGMSPVIIYEIATGGGTARAITNSTLTGTGVVTVTGTATPAPSPTHIAPAKPLVIVHNPLDEATISLPIMLGGGLGGTQSYDFTANAYRQLAAQHPMTYAIDLLLALCAIALAVSAAIPILRHWRALWVEKPNDATLPRTAIRSHYEAALLLSCLIYLVVLLFYRDVNFAAPRYLLPLFAATPIIVGAADRLLSRVQAPLLAQSWLRRIIEQRPDLRRAVPALILAAFFAPVIVWNVTGTAMITPLQTAARDHHTYWIAGDDHAIVQLFQAHHIHTFITNDYWESMRLAFETGEAATPVLEIPSRNLLGLNRYQPYVSRGLADPRPAYIEFAGSDDARFRLAQLHSGAFPGYSVHDVGQYMILLPGS